MKTHELIYTLDTIDDIARDLCELLDEYPVFTFTGNLGAGKTTLIQAIFNRCGIHEEIQSPTFTYLSTYANANGQTFYHFDLYRLKNTHDFTTMGFDEYLYNPLSWCFIEWPEIIMPLLTKKVCHITIDYHGYDRRRLRYIVI
ncbi:MAG: tRNA (adenosine(37)-N6)-threonylcarbamoyltransferase complex ATPase subunit type 1 TsaE [Candidatus Babeliaceae bacterium]|jgi:tRNA threonylcarbamoyladenosine biosynthesis protein TsaE